MARFNEILVARYNRFLQKLLAFKGGPPAAQLASEINATFSFFNGAENRYLEGWNRYGTAVAVAAFAAQSGAIRLRNPVGSNVIAVLEAASFLSTAGADQPLLEIVTVFTDLASVGTGARVGDLRMNPNSVLISSAGTTAAAGAAQIEVRGSVLNTSTDFITYEDQQIAITPGISVQIRSQVNNTAVQMYFLWRERFLEDSERT